MVGVIEFLDIEGFNMGYHAGVIDGRDSCAASPWTWRTDTGDATGKVVEDAELPEKTGKKLFWLDCMITDGRDYIETAEVWIDGKTGRQWGDTEANVFADDYLRNCLIAYAEIQGGEE